MDKSSMVLLVTQLVSLVVIVLNNKSDIKWVVKIQEQHEDRLRVLEGKL